MVDEFKLYDFSTWWTSSNFTVFYMVDELKPYDFLHGGQSPTLRFRPTVRSFKRKSKYILSDHMQFPKINLKSFFGDIFLGQKRFFAQNAQTRLLEGC